ncbi:reverse transcriptase-like protein [Elysia marginata]|uniref:Reverse transcriptase-like protein n=1 Tax=Elysia marginata TaxID=1093978 RepID=A0AAV4HEM6_9GAST|nr:reverse transcriptase-like protein [Elysia marginata]
MYFNEAKNFCQLGFIFLVLFGARVSFIACQNNNIDTSTPSRQVRGGRRKQRYIKTICGRRPSYNTNEPRLPPTLKSLTAAAATTTTTMGNDINNKQNQQAHNIPCVHLYRPPPTRANQGCDQNNLINVNLQSTVNEGPKFSREFQEIISTLNLKKGIPVILGDFNIHYDSNTCSEAKKIKGIIAAANMTQLIALPTHNKNHILDWIITKDCDIDTIKNTSS